MELIEKDVLKQVFCIEALSNHLSQTFELTQSKKI